MSTKAEKQETEYCEGSITPRLPKWAGWANSLCSASLNDDWPVKFGNKQVHVTVSRGAKKV